MVLKHRTPVWVVRRFPHNQILLSRGRYLRTKFPEDDELIVLHETPRGMLMIDSFPIQDIFLDQQAAERVLARELLRGWRPLDH